MEEQKKNALNISCAKVKSKEGNDTTFEHWFQAFPNNKPLLVSKKGNDVNELQFVHVLEKLETLLVSIKGNDVNELQFVHAVVRFSTPLVSIAGITSKFEQFLKALVILVKEGVFKVSGSETKLAQLKKSELIFSAEEVFSVLTEIRLVQLLYMALKSIPLDVSISGAYIIDVQPENIPIKLDTCDVSGMSVALIAMFNAPKNAFTCEKLLIPYLPHEIISNIFSLFGEILASEKVGKSPFITIV